MGKSPSKAEKKSKNYFILEIRWPLQESGRLVLYPGDSHIIWELSGVYGLL